MYCFYADDHWSISKTLKWWKYVRYMRCIISVLIAQLKYERDINLYFILYLVEQQLLAVVFGSRIHQNIKFKCDFKRINNMWFTSPQKMHAKYSPFYVTYKVHILVRSGHMDSSMNHVFLAEDSLVIYLDEMRMHFNNISKIQYQKRFVKSNRIANYVFNYFVRFNV